VRTIHSTASVAIQTWGEVTVAASSELSARLVASIVRRHANTAGRPPDLLPGRRPPTRIGSSIEIGDPFQGRTSSFNIDLLNRSENGRGNLLWLHIRSLLVTKKTLDRLALAVALAMFVAAIFVLYRQLENTRLIDVVSGLEALPRTHVIAALALTAVSYLLLTAYDFLAVNYVGCRLRRRDTLFASFVAFAFSNNLGFALISGGSVRYRIYSGFGLGPVAIGEIVAFCTLTYGLGVTTVAGLMFLLDPAGISYILRLPQSFLQAAGIAMLTIPMAYLAVIVVRRGPIALGRYRLRLPSIGCGLMQISVASFDQALAGAVVYVLLPPEAQIGFEAFLGIYVIAAPISLLSLVPGGLAACRT
jgi:uncharacterized membrane protein YbhN (UPF0104 family)